MDQSKFFEEVKRILNIDNEGKLKIQIAKLLGISESGAYKKIKGITQLTINEVNDICSRLNLKLGIVEGNNSGLNHPFLFYCDDLIAPPPTYEQWASNILNHSLKLNEFRSTYKVWSYQSEISYFHLLPFRYLLYFKLYAWNRSSWKIPTGDKFNTSEFRKNHALNSLLDEIYGHYVSYESIEIWHVSFLNEILSQIKYFYQLNIFASQEDLKLIFNDLRKLINHLKEISDVGYKRSFGKKKNYSSVSIYLNYTHTSSSLMFIKAPQFKIIYNLFLHPNYIRTSDKNVCNYTEHWIDKIITQSELISGAGELSRNKFFENLNIQVSNLEKELLI